MISITGDPIADFNRMDMEYARMIEHKPICSCCDEPIIEDKAIKIKEKWFCNYSECIEEAKDFLWEYLHSDYEYCLD